MYYEKLYIFQWYIRIYNIMENIIFERHMEIKQKDFPLFCHSSYSQKSFTLFTELLKPFLINKLFLLLFFKSFNKQYCIMKIYKYFNGT